MKKFTGLIITFMLFAFVGTAIAEEKCSLELVNNTDHLYFFEVKWIDHPFLKQTLGLPWSTAGGEVEPGQSWKLENYSPGLYEVECQILRVSPTSDLYKPPVYRGITVRSHVKKVTITILVVDGKQKIVLNFGYDV